MKFSSRARLLGGVALTILLYTIAGISAAKLLPGLRPPSMASAGAPAFLHRLTRTPFQPVFATGTPFQPLHPTETPNPIVQNKPRRIIPQDFYGIDFARDDLPITLEITPAGGANPILMTFLVGSPCAYRDHRACVQAYTTPQGGNVILLSIHSGVGGEGEPFRQAVEGSWINSAAASPQQVEAALAGLQNATVSIRQGDSMVVDGLRLAATVRIPPANLLDYMNTPVLSALDAAARLKPDLEPYTDPREPLIVFEICGWQLPGEAWAPGVSPASASMYLGVIQDAP